MLRVISNTITTLASFNGTNGQSPYAGLVIDAARNLYGTTVEGGSSNDGTVFKISAGTGTVTTLTTFDVLNGANPDAGLIADASGNLYGTTQSGGSSDFGTVFELTGSGFVVPEPSGLVLAAVASVALLRRRRCL